MKNHFKKITSIFLIIAIIFSFSSLCSFAATPMISVVSDKAEYAPGDTVNLDIVFNKKCASVAAFNFELTYDSSYFTVVSVTKGEGLNAARNSVNNDVFAENHSKAGVISWVLAASTNYEMNGIFASVVLTVNSAATTKKSQIKLDVKEATSFDFIDRKSLITVENLDLSIIRSAQTDMTFALNSAKTAYIVKGYNSFGNTSVEIPSTYQNLPVTEISDNVFRNHAEIKELVFGKNVEKIGSGSFYGCSGITQLTLSDNIATVGYNAFAQCTGLTDITFSKHLQTISESAFAGCYRLENLVLPTSLKTINDYAFQRCSLLKTIRISKNTTTIGNNVFQSCPTSLTIYTSEGNTKIEQSQKAEGKTFTFVYLKDITKCTIKAIPKQQYVKGGVEPSLTITSNGKTLVKGTDYTVEYKDNDDLGTATCIIQGIGNFMEDGSIEFEIFCAHDWNKTLNIKATCTRKGSYLCVCKICETSEYEYIPATGHTSDGKIVIDQKPSVFETGVGHKVCTTCRQIFDSDTVVSKLYPDINGDKTVNSSDALLALQYCANPEKAGFTAQMINDADTDINGVVNTVDALNILLIAVGRIDVKN